MWSKKYMGGGDNTGRWMVVLDKVEESRRKWRVGESDGGMKRH